MKRIDPKRATLVAITVFTLFATVELYGIRALHGWDTVFPTVAFELVAITLIVAPMVYGVMFASEHEDERESQA